MRECVCVHYGYESITITIKSHVGALINCDGQSVGRGYYVDHVAEQ